jgi:thiol-disulfide isomerase/thioredoxin
VSLPQCLAARLRTGAQAWLRNWRSHALTLLLFVAVVWGVNAWQTRNLPTGAAPAFSAPLAGAPAGTLIALDAWRAQHPGQAVALHFWADWCPICKLEEGSITAVQQDWPVLAVAMRSGAPGHVAGVLRQRGLPWASVTDPDGRIAADYGLQAVPAFIVLDAEGHIRHAAVGYTTEAGMRLRLWLAQHL